MTGIEVPSEVIDALGKGKKPPVVVTVGGYTYRNTVAVMGGRYMIALSKQHREAAGVAGGDEIDVELELDTEPREVVVPADFAAALDAEPKARAFFDGLSVQPARLVRARHRGGEETGDPREPDHQGRRAPRLRPRPTLSA